jgi:hypothetical protein
MPLGHEQWGQWYATAPRKHEPKKVNEAICVKNIGLTHDIFSLPQKLL